MQFKYLKDQYNNHLYFFEVDEDGTAYRQVTHLKDITINSARPKTGYHFFLADKEIKNGYNLLQINKDEFENEWSSSIQPYTDEWQITKKEFAVGTRVSGRFEINYPQGIIVDLNNNRYGVMKIYTNNLNSYVFPRRLINAIVSGYDHDNLWVILEEVFE